MILSRLDPRQNVKTNSIVQFVRPAKVAHMPVLDKEGSNRGAVLGEVYDVIGIRKRRRLPRNAR
jgi:hypothetical protein